jgi:uncharacterized protein (DUF2236 family)
MARTPLRAVHAVAEPIRVDMGREVRRSLGLPEVPPTRVIDPDQAYVHPTSIVRRVHNDLPAMMIGGLAALLLQTLHPLAMAGVADHSNYREDPLGRLYRTAAFVGATTFGTIEEARRAIDHVRAVHRSIEGVAPDGRHYAADDPELLTWIHVAETMSFLGAAERFGPLRLGPADRDDYYRDTAPVAYELGAQWVPVSVEQVDAYLHRIRPELYAGGQALAARDFLLRGVGRRPEDRAVHAILAAAAVSVLPGWARRSLHLPAPPVLDPFWAVLPARVLAAGLRWAVAPADRR